MVYGIYGIWHIWHDYNEIQNYKVGYPCFIQLYSCIDPHLIKMCAWTKDVAGLIHVGGGDGGER